MAGEALQCEVKVYKAEDLYTYLSAPRGDTCSWCKGSLLSFLKSGTKSVFKIYVTVGMKWYKPKIILSFEAIREAKTMIQAVRYELIIEELLH